MLVVDDEKYIADSLYQFFASEFPNDLDLDVVYAAEDAIRLIRKRRYDILLTDICMPMMDGIELMAKARLLWPDCEVIFLTGHREFDYAYEALKQGNAQYVLKTEGYEPLRQCVKRAIEEIEAHRARREQAIEDQMHRKKAGYAMQALLLQDIVAGHITALDDELFGRALCALRADRKLCLLGCGYAPLHRRMDAQDRFERLDAVLELLVPADRYVRIGMGHVRMAFWLFQESGGEGARHYQDETTFLRQNLSAIHREMERYVPELDLVFVDQMFTFGELRGYYTPAYLELRLNDRPQHAIHILSPETDALPKCAEYLPYIEELSDITDENCPAVLSNALHAMRTLIHDMVRDRTEKRTAGNRRMVEAVARIVEEQYMQPLSLTDIAEQLYFNPNYLSSLYKQMTGISIPKFITQTRLNRACALLKETNRKIKDIASEVGFGSSKYFIAVFKAEYSVTPVQWRERGCR